MAWVYFTLVYGYPLMMIAVAVISHKRNKR